MLIPNWLPGRIEKKAINDAAIPASDIALEVVRRRCRALVARRAIWSAGASALPVFGVDIAVDIHLLSGLIEDINGEFGLSPEQIEILHPTRKVAIYSVIVGAGSTLVGRVVTRDLLLNILMRSGVKLVSKNAVRLVPIAGQMVSAAIGYSAFRTVGNRHIDACEKVAKELLKSK